MSDIIEAVRKLAREDGRYKTDAYLFVFEALDHTVSKIVKEKRHVSGKELLEGVRQVAIKQFGPLTKMVFNSWGVYATDDFGEIVFNLVNKSLMGKTETDSKEDFKGIYNFDQVFGQIDIDLKKKKK